MAFICRRGDGDSGCGITHGVSVGGGTGNEGWSESTRTNGQIAQGGVNGYSGNHDCIGLGNGGVLSGNYDADVIGTDNQTNCSGRRPAGHGITIDRHGSMAFVNRRGNGDGRYGVSHGISVTCGSGSEGWGERT